MPIRPAVTFTASQRGTWTRGATQYDLVITPDGETMITTDNVAIAQFLYLLLTTKGFERQSRRSARKLF